MFINITILFPGLLLDFFFKFILLFVSFSSVVILHGNIFSTQGGYC
jgi:hypothetical protein